MTREPTLCTSGDAPRSATKPSQRCLDDEALSRMDDEGGSNNPSVDRPDAAGEAAPGS
jgi:hypothetical protein